MRAKKTWIKATIWATKDVLDVAQSAFLECGAIGIETDDGQLPENKRKFDHDNILVVGYFEQEPNKQAAILENLERFCRECGFTPPSLEFSLQHEEDWQENFVKSCTTFVVEPNIYIVPSFEMASFLPEAKGKLYIEMDPENAFGTGQHQTTKLVLKNIHDIMSRTSVRYGLDVGCGSGILAILMKKLGARDVLATEVDEDALITAQKNAQKNGVDFATRHVDEHHTYPHETYDLVAANILAPVLISMADNLSHCVADGGHLILSGILLDQAPGVIAAYQAHHLVLLKQDAMDDWCALVFSKNKKTSLRA